jgi:hypothetical protein
VGYLADVAGAAVVPVRLFGMDRFPKAGCGLAVSFGAPMRFGDGGEAAGRAGHAAFSARVLAAIHSLPHP